MMRQLHIYFSNDNIWALLLRLFEKDFYLKSRLIEKSVSEFMAGSINAYLLDIIGSRNSMTRNANVYDCIPNLSLSKKVFYLIVLLMLINVWVNELLNTYFDKLTHGQ